MAEKQTYKIFYKKFSVFGGDYLSYVKVVETDDIFHEVGKLICTSIERVKDIWYGTIRDESAFNVSRDYWESQGYRRIDGTRTWVREAPRGKRKAYVAPLINVYAF